VAKNYALKSRSVSDPLPKGEASVQRASTIANRDLSKFSSGVDESVLADLTTRILHTFCSFCTGEKYTELQLPFAKIVGCRQSIDILPVFSDRISRPSSPAFGRSLSDRTMTRARSATVRSGGGEPSQIMRLIVAHLSQHRLFEQVDEDHSGDLSWRELWASGALLSFPFYFLIPTPSCRNGQVEKSVSQALDIDVARICTIRVEEIFLNYRGRFERIFRKHGEGDSLSLPVRCLLQNFRSDPVCVCCACADAKRSSRLSCRGLQTLGTKGSAGARFGALSKLRSRTRVSERGGVGEAGADAAVKTELTTAARSHAFEELHEAKLEFMKVFESIDADARSPPPPPLRILTSSAGSFPRMSSKSACSASSGPPRSSRRANNPPPPHPTGVHGPFRCAAAFFVTDTFFSA
jgi:hypothetical protein